MTPTPCCSGISGKTPGVYVLDANTTVIVPGGSKSRSSNRGVWRHSNLTNAEINSQCASEHLSGMGPFSLEQEDAYDQCVSDMRAGRASGRIQTYQNIAEWFARTFMGRPSNQGGQGGGVQNPPDNGMGSVVLWVAVIILILILMVLAMKFFRKKGG